MTVNGGWFKNPRFLTKVGHGILNCCNIHFKAVVAADKEEEEAASNAKTTSSSWQWQLCFGS